MDLKKQNVNTKIKDSKLDPCDGPGCHGNPDYHAVCHTTFEIYQAFTKAYPHLWESTRKTKCASN